MSQGTWYQPLDSSGKPILDKNKKPIPGRGYICMPIGRASSLVKAAWFSLATGWNPATATVWFMGTDDGKAAYLYEETFDLPINARRWWELPDGTDQIACEFNTPNSPADPVGWCVEIDPR